MTEKLFTVNEVAKELGVTRPWIHSRIRNDDSPRADFTMAGRGCPQLLWTETSLNRWRTYKDSGERVSGNSHYAAYSDHRAVNRVGRISASWKLWWRTTHDGNAVWWYSTPTGWWISDDDGRTWRNSGLWERPGDYRYCCVNDSVNADSASKAVQRNARKLKDKLMKWSQLYDDR